MLRVGATAGKQNMLAINSIWRAMREACDAFVYCHLLILQACKYARRGEGRGRQLLLLLLLTKHKSFACPGQDARQAALKSCRRATLSQRLSCCVSFSACFSWPNFRTFRTRLHGIFPLSCWPTLLPLGCTAFTVNAKRLQMLRPQLQLQRSRHVWHLYSERSRQ